MNSFENKEKSLPKSAKNTAEEVINNSGTASKTIVTTAVETVEKPQSVSAINNDKIKRKVKKSDTVIPPEEEGKKVRKSRKVEKVEVEKAEKKVRKVKKSDVVVQLEEEKKGKNTEKVEEKKVKEKEKKIEKVEEEQPKEEEKIQNKDRKNYPPRSREELVEDLRELLLEPAVENIRTAVDTIKQAFYKHSKQDNPTSETEETDNVIEKVLDNVEVEFKQLLAKYKDLKAATNAKIEEQREKNLQLKQQVLLKLEALTSSTEDLSATIPAFRKLQHEWKKIEQVPQNMVTEIWKQYNRYQEKFYDLIKINNDLREYDFRKNLELKTVLCLAVEKLERENDAVFAVQTLQKLHEEWREIGPVSREDREDIWNRFKEGSSKINKKHQAYFDELKKLEEHNLKLKIELCEKIEQIDFAKLKTLKQWNGTMAEIFAIQNQWKETGSASKKANPKVFRRFRTACDNFFKEKGNFYKTLKEDMSQNLTKRKELLAKAEELKGSTDWKETGHKLISLQKEWKNIGITTRKQTDDLWDKFTAACNHFFEQRKQNSSNKKDDELENLKLKNEFISEKIEKFTSTGNTFKDVTALKKLIEEYNQIGFVPKKDKNALQERFRVAVDGKFNEIHQFKEIRRKNEPDNAQRENTKSTEIHDRVNVRTLRRELAIYENNIGFLNTSSPKGSALLDEINKKVDDLKQKIAKMGK
ncbi:MAG: DUF349 domain-containing protein [Prevotellaceae bacterium]|jgi:hypothetical protein|nr:DUF349 domain-containing protein [Prevotellaceae bacterium]